MASSQYSLIKSSGLVYLFMAAALTGCDAPPPPAEKPAAAPAPSQSEAFSAAGRSWIDVNDKISPAVWLASREAGRDVPPNDPAANSMRALLSEADARFTEGPRMSANRAVQIETMLAERGVRESARGVIEGLVSIGEPGERAGFGETGGHYVNARIAAPDRSAALEAMRKLPQKPAVPLPEADRQ